MTTSTDTARQHAAAPASRQAAGVIQLFDTGALQRRAMGMPLHSPHQHTVHDPDTDPDIAHSGNDDLDDGERRRRDWHCKMLQHPQGAGRALVMPSRGMMNRIARLLSKAPHFSDMVDWIARATRLAIMTKTPLRLPPCLLVGPPGIGKTWLMRQLAEVLGTPALFIAMNTLTDRGSALTGLGPGWKSAGPGKIARQLIDGSAASPIVLLDEIDKISPLNPAETPVECLHTLLEPENSRAFIDEFVDVPIDASHILWFASANDVSALPASILDRFLVFHINVDDMHRRQIAREIFATANADFAYRFSLAKQDLFEAVLDLTPRRATRLWPMAFGFAAEGGRDFVILRDIRAAKALLERSVATARPIGFIPSARASR